jgi:hypothetical protein
MGFFKTIHFETQNNPFSFLDFLGGFWARFGCRLLDYLFVYFLRVFGGGSEGLFLFAIHVKRNVILYRYEKIYLFCDIFGVDVCVCTVDGSRCAW